MGYQTRALVPELQGFDRFGIDAVYHVNHLMNVLDNQWMFDYSFSLFRNHSLNFGYECTVSCDQLVHQNVLDLHIVCHLSFLTCQDAICLGFFLDW